MWVGNGSVATLDNLNITVHNGAANVYTFGTGSETTITNSQLYSSGPVSHGLYAAGNGTIYGQYLKHYSGGDRSSAFSGDSPGGYIHVRDSVAHTDGIGSAVCYALGLCNITNVIGHASRSPIMFMDGVQEGIWTNCDLTAGLLAGFIMFSSGPRSEGATLLIENSKVTVLGDEMPGIFMGNTIATATIISSQLNVSASGILAVANYSQVTQDFDYFADYSNAPWLSPAEATIYVEDSALQGDIVAYNGSSIDFYLSDETSWIGKGYSGFGLSTLAVTIDATSNWTLTGDTTLQNFTDADMTFTNIIGNGHTIWYNETAPANAYLENGVYKLSGGGKLRPAGTGNLAAHGYWGGYGMNHQKTPTTTYAYAAPTWVY